MTKEERTQQQELGMIITEHIAPAMRELGFRRDRRRFTREDGAYTKTAKVHSSRWNDREEVQFTLELDVYEGSDEVVSTQAHNVIPGRKHWYKLTPVVDPNEVGQEVARDIREYVGPFFNRYD